MPIQLFGQFRISDVRLGLNKSQHLQIFFTYSRFYSRISITYSRIYSRICRFYSRIFKLNTCTENILFKKMGMPTLIMLGIFENITYTGTELICQSDIAEKGGDDWILGIRLKIFRGYLTRPRGTIGIFRVYTVILNNEFGDAVIASF